MDDLHPLLILGVGLVTVVGLIVFLHLNAFIGLLIAAIVVSLLAPGPAEVKISRVAEAFGTTAGTIGIVIALASVTGKGLVESGAADRIVQSFVSLLGVRRAAMGLTASAFVLSVPVFFDTVFYLLVPLARSMYRRMRRHYLRYLMAVAAGAAITHTLVPPTPGPLVIAETLEVDIGVLFLAGVLIALPAVIVGLWFARWLDLRMPLSPEPEATDAPDHERSPKDRQSPGLFPSLLPILAPVVLVSANTVVSSVVQARGEAAGMWAVAAPYAAIFGNVNLALLISAAVAVWLYYVRRSPGRAELSVMIEQALMSGGVIVLITVAGGAFGMMLQAAEVGPAIESLFATGAGRSGFDLLFLAFGIASLIKFAQGSSTVAMITTAGIVASMAAGPHDVPFHRVYLVTAIGSGSLVGSWMNDSGFWIYTRMGGLTAAEALRSWTPLLAILGIAGMATTLLLAVLAPLV